MTNDSRPRILAVGDAVAPTGFARVTRHILQPMVGDFDVHQLAVNYNGDPHTLPWKLYPAATGGDLIGTNRLPELVDQIRPDLLFLAGNLDRVHQYLVTLEDKPNRPATVAYSPVEAAPVSRQLVETIPAIDCQVFYTQFAKREFDKALEANGDRSPNRDVRVIPHGVDCANFQPLGGRTPIWTQGRRQPGGYFLETTQNS